MSMTRRKLLTVAAAGVGLVAAPAYAQHMGHMAPAAPGACPGDGTPMQFIPKKPADPMAAQNDIAKYPACPYCGMNRGQFHHSRMLVHYSDDLPDGTCSLHCAAISLSLNVDRGPKAIYVADFATQGDQKALIEVAQATFLVGSALQGVMTKRSKVAYGSEAAAKAAQTTHGGELMNFDQALLAAHTDLAQDVAMIRKMREERRKKMPMEHKG
jgi:nitrous oxide reductase accessory protein NosL